MKIGRRTILVSGVAIPFSLACLAMVDWFYDFPLNRWLSVNGRPEGFRITPLAFGPTDSTDGPISDRNALLRLCNMKDLGVSDVMHLARLLKAMENNGGTFSRDSSEDLCLLFLDDSKVKSHFGARSGIFVPRGSHFEVKKGVTESSDTHVSEAHQDYLLFTMAECGIPLDAEAFVCGRTAEKPLRSRFNKITGDIQSALGGVEVSMTVSAMLLYGGSGLVDCEFVADRLIGAAEPFCYDLHRFYAIAGLVQMNCLPQKTQSRLHAVLDQKTNTMLDSQGKDGAWRNSEGQDSLVITSHQLEWWYLHDGKSRIVEKAISRAIGYLAGKFQLATDQELKNYFPTWCHVARCLIIDDWRRGHVFN